MIRSQAISLATWLVAAIFSVTLLTAREARSATPSNWNGSLGEWNDHTRWSSNPFFPTNGNGALEYDVVIGAGTVNLNTVVDLASLTLNGGTLSGASDWTVDVFTINGAAVLATTGTLSAGTSFLNNGTLGRDLTLSGSANTIQNVRVAGGFTLTNPVGATLTAPTGPGERETNGPGMLLNQGKFIKTGGTRYYASLPMNNDGLVDVQQGTVRLNSTGTHTGTFTVSSAGELELAGTQTFQPSATISGAGGVHILSGTATIDSEVAVDYLWLSGGSVEFRPGVLAVTGRMHD